MSAAAVTLKAGRYDARAYAATCSPAYGLGQKNSHAPGSTRAARCPTTAPPATSAAATATPSSSTCTASHEPPLSRHRLHDRARRRELPGAGLRARLHAMTDAARAEDGHLRLIEQALQWNGVITGHELRRERALAALSRLVAERDRFLNERDEWVVNERDHWRDQVEALVVERDEARQLMSQREDWLDRKLEDTREQLAAAEARCVRLTQTLRHAVTELERLGERDLNHDGFGAPDSVNEADCSLCVALSRARAVLAGRGNQPQENDG